MLQNLIVEGLDRLGKSTLLHTIENKLGCFTKLHFGKPPSLEHYQTASPITVVTTSNTVCIQHIGEKERYQRDSFKQMFSLLEVGSSIMLDRAHLGEAVYANRYRSYDGNYVFEYEAASTAISNTLLVLLVNHDHALEQKLVDDGESFDWTKRAEEQDDFITAFNRSRMHHKMILPVGKNGAFVEKDALANAVIQRFTSV